MPEKRYGLNIPDKQRRIVIEGVTPLVDKGRYAVKAVIEDVIEIGADIFKDGHEKLRAAILWRPLPVGRSLLSLNRKQLNNRGGYKWNEAPMKETENDRWVGKISFDRIGPWCYTICAWTDRFGTWAEELKKKSEAGMDISGELLEGIETIRKYAANASEKDASAINFYLDQLLKSKNQSQSIETALGPELGELMYRSDPREDETVYDIQIPIWVDRKKARFGAWYEIFVRSQGTDATRSATLMEAEKRLEYISSLGFDVLYLTPIHPIGKTNRKGPNNSTVCREGDPGSPWAIGDKTGGHTAVHPDLGTIEDFDHFVKEAGRYGLEIALDFAVQCSPDHPWVKEHPEWFYRRPDGTIKYAENPPKKYEDIYPIDFDTSDRKGLYTALLDVVLFWIKHGVKIFRVDNPHTKPVGFWEWLIDSVHCLHPDVIFLSEAFTRPKRMKMLAKIGFSQSYTYFTWRNTRSEIESYAYELFCTDVRYYLRPNFFANTPDILHEFLQKGGRPAFMIRLILAATLSPSYGIYNGFEICENRALRPGSEEYLDSEKYQYKVWDMNREGNIKSLIAAVNNIRLSNPALHTGDNLRITDSTNPDITAYVKATPAMDNVLLVVVNVNPYSVKEGTVTLPCMFYNGGPGDTYYVTDLLTGSRYEWRGEVNYVRLDPFFLPAHILRIR